jgi:hypothetical protein
MTDKDVEVTLAQELLIPFMVNGDHVYFKLICPKCASSFFLLSDDIQTISCDNMKCDAIPLVRPIGLGEWAMWKL